MSEPVEHCVELDEREKSRREFVVAGADAAMALDATGEVFNPTPSAIVAAAKGIGVEAFVGNSTASRKT